MGASAAIEPRWEYVVSLDETAVQDANGSSATEIRLLVIRLDGQEFALDVDDVSEVVRMVALTSVPEGPLWLCGLLNLRGRVVPVVDLRTRLGLPQRPPDLASRILVVEADGRPMGALVDEATEVLVLPASALHEPDEATGNAHALAAVARDGERLIPVLDPIRLFAGVEAAAGDPEGTGS